MLRLIDKIEKFNNDVSNHYINIQINVMPFGINCCFRQLYLIPTIELDIYKNNMDISIYVLCFCLYLNISLKNYKTDES